MNTSRALRPAAMELKRLMLVSTTKWLTAGTPLALLKCNRCIAPAIGRLYGAGRTNMKKLLAILLLCAGDWVWAVQLTIDANQPRTVYRFYVEANDPTDKICAYSVTMNNLWSSTPQTASSTRL